MSNLKGSKTDQEWEELMEEPIVSIPVTFSKEDMMNFAGYLRNGLSNMEYCLKEPDQHLVDWYTRNHLVH